MSRMMVCRYVSHVGQGGEQDRDVHLQLKHGVEAKNYDDVSIVSLSLCVYLPCTYMCTVG